jgi:FtsZ-binding cell division protein ZapB
MKLEEFERLQDLVKETTDLVMRLKFENRELKEKCQKLETKQTVADDKTVQKLKRLEKENIFLKQQQEKAVSRLMHLKNNVQAMSKGVES